MNQNGVQEEADARLSGKSLGILVTHATQFDGPLFRYLSREAHYSVTVYFSHRRGDELSRDSELASEWSWDHDVRSGYQSVVRQAGALGIPRLLWTLLSARHDLLVISGYTPMVHLLTAFLGRAGGMKVGLRSDTILSYGQPSGLKKILKDVALPFVLRLYATGHPTGSLAADYLARHGMRKEATFLFPYNVDNQWLSSAAALARRSCQSLRAKYGIPANALIVLGVVKFVPREDPLTLLFGFTRLRETMPDAHLVLVGEGELRHRIESEVRQARIQANVHLPGYIPYSQLPSHYAMADIFVHPAVREQWGVSVNEAMVCGVPVVVSSSVGAGHDLVVEGESGFVFSSGDADALARTLVRLAESPSLRKRVAENASVRIAQWNYGQTTGTLGAALEFVARANAAARASLDR